MPQEQAAARRLAIATFAISSIALFMTSLDNLVVITALPVIKESLGASLSQLEWTVNAYTLTFAVLLLTGAALGDRFGRKRMFIIGVALFTGASAFAALAPTGDLLVIARALQGFGAAIVTPLTLTILSDAVPSRAPRPRARRVGRDRRPRHRARAARRRRDRRGPQLAVHLLGQRPDRHRPRSRSRPCSCARPTARTARSTCPAWASSRAACSPSCGA